MSFRIPLVEFKIISLGPTVNMVKDDLTFGSLSLYKGGRGKPGINQESSRT